MLSSLLAPLRLPERALEALDSVAAAARELGSELTRVREQTARLGQLVPIADQIREHAELIPRVLAVTERISDQAKPLSELLPALERLEQELVERVDALREVVSSLESEESYLNKRIEEVVKEMTAMHETVSGLQDDVERITDRLPDPGEKRGPLQTARDVLTGGDE